MTRSRDWALVAALALVLAVTGSVRPDGRKETAASNEAQQVKLYALGELASRAGDPGIGDWLAQTIPQVIDTGSWSTAGGAGSLRYYAQGKLLIVNNQPAVQEKVRAFLDGLKNELSRGKSPASKDTAAIGKTAVIPARLSSPDLDPMLPAPDPAFQPQFVSEPARHYGHLLLEGVSFKENQFKLKKFSIMYRGEGLIDDTLARLIKSLNKQSPTPLTAPNDVPVRQPTTPQEPGANPASPPRPADSPTGPEDDEPTIGSRTPSSDKTESIPAPKKARRPARTTSKAAKSTFVQSRYAPAPRLAAPERPVVQVILPEEAKHYAHLVVEGLSYSEKGVDLKKLSVVYRGDGIIDSNVAKVIKALQGNMPRWNAEGCVTLPSPSVPSPPSFRAPSPPGTASTSPAATLPGNPNETNLRIRVIDIGDGVEVGKHLTYRLTVTNAGTMTAEDVVIRGIVPAEMKVVAAIGPGSVEATIAGQLVWFSKLKQVEPGKSCTYSIKVKALKAGDVRFHAQLSSSSFPGPIAESESTVIIEPERSTESSREELPPSSRTQIRFTKPAGMTISWFDPHAGGVAPANSVEAPGRFNFKQGAIYRLKAGNLKGRSGLEIYPTLEVVPVNPKTKAYLSKNAVDVSFTSEDIKQVAKGYRVVKVIYLPEAEAGGTSAQPQEIVSTRLEAGADPIAEAQRRGSILLVIRLGNDIGAKQPGGFAY